MTFFKLTGHINGNMLNKTVKHNNPLISAIEAEILNDLGSIATIIEKKVLVAGEKIAYHKGQAVYIELTKIK